MGAWSKDSKTHVAHMHGGDFRWSEKSVTIAKEGNVRVELATADGKVKVLKERIPVLNGKVIDGAVMSVGALNAFLGERLKTQSGKACCSRCT